MVIVLFMVAPFTLSYNDSDKAEILKASFLPPAIATIASLIRWIILGIIGINFLFILQKNLKNISRPVVFLALFYIVQLVYGLTDGFDVPRFFLLSFFAVSVPLHLSFSFKYFKKQLINIFSFFIYGFIILSLFLNGSLILQGQRFFGFINNSNLYGMTAVFWALILILKLKSDEKKRNITVIIFLITVILTIILSGSRNALVGIAIVLVFSYYNKIKSSIIFLILLALSLSVLTHFVNINFVEERLFNISNSIEDSGREKLWQTAYRGIETNYFTGNGMNANIEISSTGNMHNSYIRFLLNMGLVFTVLALLQYFISLFLIFKMRKKIPLSLFAFMLAYTVANIGEDYFVGLGSSMFVYVLLTYGLINYYIIFPEDKVFQRTLQT